MAPIYSSLGGSIGNLIIYALIVVFIVMDVYVNSKPAGGDTQKLSSISSIIKGIVFGLLIPKVLIGIPSDIFHQSIPGLLTPFSRSIEGSVFNMIFYLITMIALGLDVYKTDKNPSTQKFVDVWKFYVLPPIISMKIVKTSFDISRLDYARLEQTGVQAPVPVPTGQTWNQMAEDAAAAEIAPPQEGFLVEQPNETVTAATVNNRTKQVPPKRINAIVKEAGQGGN
jgi:hypothetical protein